MRAVKDNKQYRIDESDVKRYVEAGYDIVDNEGNVVKHGKGKTVSYEKYAEVLAENEALKSELAEYTSEKKEPEQAEKEPEQEKENVPTTKKTGKKAGA